MRTWKLYADVDEVAAEAQRIKCTSMDTTHCSHTCSFLYGAEFLQRLHFRLSPGSVPLAAASNPMATLPQWRLHDNVFSYALIEYYMPRIRIAHDADSDLAKYMLTNIVHKHQMRMKFC